MSIGKTTGAGQQITGFQPYDLNGVSRDLPRDYYVGTQASSDAGFPAGASGLGASVLTRPGMPNSAQEIGDFAIGVQPDSFGRLVSFSRKTGERFHAYVVFHNGSRLEFDCHNNGDGKLAANLDSARFYDEEGEIHTLAMSATDTGNRFHFAFTDGVAFQFQFEIESDRAPSFDRVVLSRTQPTETFPTETENLERFNVRTQDWTTPDILNVQFITNEKKISGVGRGRCAVYEVYLSDGGVVQITLYADHNGGGGYSVEGATYFSPESSAASGIDILDFVKDKKGPGSAGETVIIYVGGRKTGLSSGLLLRFPIRLPESTVGGAEYAGDAEVLSVPKRKPPVAKTESAKDGIFSTNGNFLLTPKPASARTMANPPVGNQEVVLYFTGTLGDRKIGDNSPLIIRGQFRGATFVPDTVPRVVYLAPRGTETPPCVVYEVVRRDGGGYELRVHTTSGTQVAIGSASFAGVFGFGRNATALNSELRAIYSIQPVSVADGEKLPSDWQNASDEIFTEVRRFFNASLVDWSSDDSVRVSAGDSTRVQIRLRSGDVLHFRRSVTGGELNYALVAQTGLRTDVLSLDTPADSTLVGLWLRSDDAASGSVVSPWQGSFSPTSLGSTQQITFTNSLVTSLRVDFDRVTGSLRVHFPQTLQATERAAFIPTEGQELLQSFSDNHSDRRLIAILADGRQIEIEYPNTMTAAHNPLDVLFNSPTHLDVLDYKMKVRLLDARGRLISDAGAISGKSGVWQIHFPEAAGFTWSGTAVEAIEAGDGTGYALRFTDMPQPVAVRPREEPTAPPPPSPLPETAAVALPTRTAAPAPAPFGQIRTRSTTPASAPEPAGLPWRDGYFLLPNEATRALMRRANQEDDQPTRDERARFVFETDDFLTTNRRLRIVIPVSFGGTQWQPALGDRVVVDVLDDSGAVIATHERDVRLIRTPAGLGLQLGDTEAQTLSLYHVEIPVPIAAGGTRPAASTYFGVSLGERSDEAASSLLLLETSDSLAAGLAARPGLDDARSTPVEHRTEEGHAASVAAEFFDPLMSLGLTAHGNRTVMEFAPGLSESIPDARFSRLRVFDLSGLNWSFVFQQDNQSVGLVSVLVGDTPIVLARDQITNVGDSRFEYRGSLPAMMAGQGVAARYNVPVVLRWEVKGTEIRITAVQIGDDVTLPNDMIFDPAGMDDRQIRANRKPRDVRVSQRRIAPPRRVSGRGVSSGEFAWSQPRGIAGLAEDADSSQNMLVSGHNGEEEHTAQLSENIWVDYDLTTSGGTSALHAQILIHYNTALRCYEPVLRLGRAQLRFAADGGGYDPVDVTCQVNPSAQNQWILRLPENGPVLFFSNWTVAASLRAPDARPLPMLWESGGEEPRRAQIEQVMIQAGLLAGTMPVQVLLPPANQVFEAVIVYGVDIYRIPFREADHPSLTRPILVPVGPAAHTHDGAEMAPEPVEYFQPSADRAGVLRLSNGREYEIQIGGRTDSPRGRYLELNPVHPGDSGTLTERRIRRSLTLSAGEGGAVRQSSHMLLDLDSTTSTQAQWNSLRTTELQDGSQPLLRRFFRDVISGEELEFVFTVQRGVWGDELRLIGVARVLPNGDDSRRVDVLPIQVAVSGSTEFIRLDDTGEYLSLPVRLGRGMLSITSYGRNLNRETLDGLIWQRANPANEIFTGEVIERAPEEAKDPSYNPWNERSNRVAARTQLSQEFDIDPWLLERMVDEVPEGETARAGVRVSYEKGDFEIPATGPYNLNFPRVSDDSSFIYRIEMNGHEPQRVLFRVSDDPRSAIEVPFALRVKFGRRFLILSGPLAGVVLTESYNGWGDYGSDIETREILEHDLTGLPSRRTRGMDDFSDDRPQVVTARNRHVARICMSELAAANVLPATGSDQPDYALNLFNLMIPNADLSGFTYNQITLHRAFRLLVSREWNVRDRHTADVRKRVMQVRDGTLSYADFARLIECVTIYENWRGNSDTVAVDHAYDSLRKELTRLARVTPGADRGDTLFFTNRTFFLDEQIQTDDVRAQMGLLYGDPSDYATQLLTTKETTQQTSQWLQMVRDYAGGYRFAARQGSVSLAEFQSRLTRLGSQRPLPVALEAALTFEFGYRMQQGDAYNDAAVAAATQRLIEWQDFFAREFDGTEWLLEAPILRDQAALDRLVREVVMVPLAAAPQPKIEKPRTQRPPRPSSGDASSPRSAALAPAAPAPLPAFTAYTSLFGDVRTRGILPVDPRITVRDGVQSVDISDDGPSHLTIGLNVRFASGRPEFQIREVSDQDAKEGIPVYLLPDNRLWIFGHVFQVIFDPVARRVVGLLPSASSKSVDRPSTAPIVMYDPQSDDDQPVSNWLTIQGVGVGGGSGMEEDSGLDFDYDGLPLSTVDTSSIGRNELSGVVAIGNLGLFSYEVDFSSLPAGESDFALVLVGRDGAAEAEQAARDRGMGIVIIMGTENLDLNAADLRATMEALREELAIRRMLEPSAIEFYRADRLLVDRTSLTAAADLAILPSEDLREFYLSLAGVEIDPNLTREALQIIDPLLYQQLLPSGFEIPSDLGQWFVDIARYRGGDLQRIWQDLQAQGVDVVRNPEAVVYEFLATEARVRSGRVALINTTSRDAFASQLRLLTLTEDLPATSGTEDFAQALETREAERRAEEAARWERLVRELAERR